MDQALTRGAITIRWRSRPAHMSCYVNVNTMPAKPNKRDPSMTDPGQEAVVERLARLDLQKPRVDQVMVERALEKHLSALDLPDRPCRWMPDFGSTLQYVMEGFKNHSGGDVEWEAAFGNDMRTFPANADVLSKVRALNGACEAIVNVAINRAWDRAKRSARAAAQTAIRNGALHSEVDAALDAAWRRARLWGLGRTAWFESDVNEWNEAWDTAWSNARSGQSGWATFSEAVRNVLGITGAREAARRAAYRIASKTPEMEDTRDKPVFVFNAAAQVNLDQMSVSDVDILLPIVDALEAGLFLFWMLPDEVVCVPHPSISIVDQRVHRPDGPAVAWESGECHWFWRGVWVPQWLIEAPSKITSQSIMSERNQELRRCMIERFGAERLIREGNAQLVSEDQYGRLWRCDFGDRDPYTIVEVRNATIDPDGTHRTYFLSVPPAMNTAHEAVAWTYGLTPEQYHDVRRT